jgi:hypothetical protein
VPVVNEFPDVFPKELPSMPPDRDIEFVIELKPDTTPIYKTPYRMATLELAKLKENIKELLEKEHGEHLHLALQRLREHRLYAKLSKCEFWMKQVAFLGHVISKGGISVDPSKVQGVLSWNAPTSVSDIHSFLGLARYY